ncbi:MAG: zinc-binding dehydrogenase [Spirochaetota bacterium]
MKAAVANGDGTIHVVSVPEPAVGPYQCLCKINACASCTGTDQKIVAGHFGGKDNFPGVLGHESVGRVVSTGAKVRHIKEGDVFLRPSSVYPGGRLGSYGSLWGCFAEYGIVTDIDAFREDKAEGALSGYTTYQQKIPSDAVRSDEEMTMLITLKELSSFLVNCGVAPYSSIVVLGTGAVAMAAVYFAKLLGVHPVIAVGRRDEALAHMKEVGADHTINIAREDMIAAVRKILPGVNLVVDTTGNVELASKALDICAPNGRVVMYALPEKNDITIPWDHAIGKSMAVVGPSENKAHQYLIDLIRLNAVPLKKFYSHTMPLADIAEGFAMLKEKKATKIVFTI